MHPPLKPIFYLEKKEFLWDSIFMRTIDFSAYFQGIREFTVCANVFRSGRSVYEIPLSTYYSMMYVFRCVLLKSEMSARMCTLFYTMLSPSHATNSMLTN